MPGFDGTGPRGLGPMTGGGRGFCAVPLPRTLPAYMGRAAYPPYGVPYYGAGLATPGAAPFAPQMTREQERDFLSSQVQALKERLQKIDARIQELGS